jgi:PAS domain S-box-containing protein
MQFLMSIQSLSLVLLLLGIGLAFSRIRLSRWVLGWILLTGALLLQGFRSMLSYFSEHGGLDATMYTVANDWMGLGFSLLIVASMHMMREVFAAHRLADETLRVVSAAANDAIIMMDNMGTVAVWNEAAQRIFGYSEQEAQGKKLSELIVPERYRTDFEQGFSPSGSADRGSVTSKPMELAGLRKDGAEIITEYSLSRLSIDGKWYVIYIVRDITERKRAEDEIHWLNQRLEHRVMERTRELKRSNEELEAFSYSVAHDLRTPLRSINGFSAILAAEYAGALDARAQDYLQRIRAATGRMGDVMDDLQALAYTSRTELQRQEVDLSAMAREVAASVGEKDPQRRVEFVIAPGMVASADPGLMRIALDNLFGNAWKFTSKRENAIIEFGLTTAEGKRAYFLRDNGIGFDPAFSGKLFGQFQRLHTDTEYKGVGMGLAIVARVIRRHEGQIWAEGAVEQGATFYFTLA